MNLIILAGGKSSRFGKDKAFTEFKGVPIVVRILRALGPLFDGTIVVTNHPAGYASFNCRIVPDQYKNIGPLGGLHAGLVASDSEHNFVVACDMPLIAPDLVKHLIGINGYDAVVPAINGFPEPLLALYSKVCLTALEEMIRENSYKISRLYDKVNTKFVPENELRNYDRDLLSFSNINTLPTLKKHEEQN
jgi:molybdopterin-guanine dinucleotide biosynthesis protein A